MDTESIIKQIDIIRIKNNRTFSIQDAIIDEKVLTLNINGEKAFEMVFSITHPLYLAAGFLFTQGIIRSQTDIREQAWFPDNQICNLTLSQDAVQRLERFKKKGTPVKGSSGGSLLPDPGSGHAIKEVHPFTITPDQVLSLTEQHWQHSKMFHQTGAVHSAGLSDGRTILEYYEDIGRHNAVDKLAGSVLLNRTDTGKKIATLSCRMSLEIIGKIIKTRIPIVISNAAPTLSAVSLARSSGLTIIGFARDNQFNIYTHGHRIRPGGSAPSSANHP